MSRKLRFFKDQISKASLLSSMRPVMQPDIELEDLEVIFLKKKPALIKFYLFFFTGFASIFLWSLRT
jgi:V-type H+-transporting ATPase subunit a